MSLNIATLTEQDLLELRALLDRLREENEADLRRARATLLDLSADGLLVDPSMREESTNAEYLLADASGILEHIDAALRRMAEGTYGTCTSCGTAIPLGRLRARPYSPTCVRCTG